MADDSLSDTAYIARAYCPKCEPNTDPTEEILETRWCESHCPTRDGISDADVLAAAYLSGSAEAGGEDNKKWCDILHRKKEPV